MDFDAFSIFCNQLGNFMSKPCIKLNGDEEHTGSLKKWAQTSIGAHWIIYWMEYNWSSLDYECREYSEDQGPRNTAPGSGNIVSKVDFKGRHLSKYLPRHSNSSQSKTDRPKDTLVSTRHAAEFMGQPTFRVKQMRPNYNSDGDAYKENHDPDNNI